MAERILRLHLYQWAPSRCVSGGGGCPATGLRTEKDEITLGSVKKEEKARKVSGEGAGRGDHEVEGGGCRDIAPEYQNLDKAEQPGATCLADLRHPGTIHSWLFQALLTSYSLPCVRMRNQTKRVSYEVQRWGQRLARALPQASHSGGGEEEQGRHLLNFERQRGTDGLCSAG